tara:strand:+ start:85 stop:354 length:270 start_codon:yes stop_codon:yes gene_type:complete
MKLDRHELQKQILDHIDVLNERFTDRKFRLKYYAHSMKKKYGDVGLQCLTDTGRRSTVIPARPEKQLLEAIQLFDLGCYMYQESVGYFA